jgi:hypothetical protein
MVRQFDPAVPSGPLYEYYDAFGNLELQASTVTTTEDYFPPMAGRNYVEYSYATLYLHTSPLGSVGTTTGGASGSAARG